MTASRRVNNRPAYMTGFNYYPHLEHLSALLHPKKAIISNRPFLRRHYEVHRRLHGGGHLVAVRSRAVLRSGQPMFFLMYNTSDREIELMFQRCLLLWRGLHQLPEGGALTRPVCHVYADVGKTLPAPLGLRCQTHRSGRWLQGRRLPQSRRVAGRRNCEHRTAVIRPGVAGAARSACAHRTANT